MKVKILGTGAYAPEKVLDNAYFEKIVETSDAWIVERSGIRQRRVAAPGQATSDLAAEAARRALEASGTRPEEVDTLLVATSSPDRIVPPTAVYVQKALGCWNAGASDLIAACSGFAYGLAFARALVASGQSRRCLLIGAEELSRITNYKDRTTCVLFGDGAGAAVLGPSDDDSDILYARTGADGRLEDLIIVPTGGTATPTTPETLEKGLHFIHMKGREVYKFAVTQMQAVIEETCADAGVRVDDLALIIPHQSNLRIIESAVERAGLPQEKVLVNIDRYGNTSAASVAVALHEARAAGRLRSGDLVMLVAFGAGLTWGSVLLRV